MVSPASETAFSTAASASSGSSKSIFMETGSSSGFSPAAFFSMSANSFSISPAASFRDFSNSPAASSSALPSPENVPFMSPLNEDTTSSTASPTFLHRSSASRSFSSFESSKMCRDFPKSSAIFSTDFFSPSSFPRSSLTFRRTLMPSAVPRILTRPVVRARVSSEKTGASPRFHIFSPQYGQKLTSSGKSEPHLLHFIACSSSNTYYPRPLPDTIFYLFFRMSVNRFRSSLSPYFRIVKYHDI